MHGLPYRLAHRTARNLPLKFHQNRVSYSWDITDIEFLRRGWGGILCKVIFVSNPTKAMLGWGWVVFWLSWSFDNEKEARKTRKIYNKQAQHLKKANVTILRKHMGQYEAKRVIQGHMGSYRTIQDQMGPNRTLLEHIGPSWFIWDQTGPNWAIRGHMGPYKPYGVIPAHLRSYGAIMDHMDHTKPNRTILEYKGQ